MAIHGWQRAIAFCLGMSGAIGLSISPAVAQLVADPSLGTTVEPFNAQIDLIKNGVRPANGANLFHSFQEFNVGQNRGVYFVVPDANVLNILARVTGGNPSQILGILGTRQQLADGTFLTTNANLFLMNPNGIIFGQGAQLDVGGSFVATTANAIQFGDRGSFSATNPGVPSSVLTINPSAFLFNQIPIGAIVNNSRANAGQDPSNSFNTFGLRVPDGKSLLLLGGDVTANGGGIVAFGGRIEIGGVTGVGAVGLSISGDTLSLNFPNDLARADVTLTNRSGFLATTAGGGGDITINARNINLSGRSTIQAGIGRNLGVSDSQAGNITLNATDNLTVAGSSEISNNVFSNGKGSSGNIYVTSTSLHLINNAVIDSRTFSKGNAGSINIQALHQITLDRSSYIFNNVEAGGDGNTGGIDIKAGSIFLSRGSQIQSFLRDADATSGLPGGRGRAGNVKIHATSSLTISGRAANSRFPSAIFSSARSGTQGDSGNIDIFAGSIVLDEDGSIFSYTLGSGRGGNIFIQADNLGNLEETT